MANALHAVCFTINNPTDEDVHSVETFANEHCVYLVYGRETGESGTPHLQGYCELKAKKRLKNVSQLLPRAHLEGRKGTQKQAIEYCKKDGNVTEFGTPRVSGKRTDLDAVRSAALENGMRHVTSVYNYQQIRTAEKFLDFNEEPRDWETNVIWIWGPTGTGKSRKARELCGDDTYIKNTPTTWWDGYDGHENIILDDFRDSWFPITYMLALCDRYEFRAQVKGGHRQLKPKTIVVTSAYPPNECYRGTGEAINQLIRRIKTVIELVPAVPEVEG